MHPFSSPYNSQARARFQKQAAVSAEPKERVDILVRIHIQWVGWAA